MIEAQVPEYADGGYWYVVPVVSEPGTGSSVPDLPSGTPYAQWMNDGNKCVVRLLSPIAGLAVIVPPAELLPIPRKPRARIEGR